MLVFEKGYLEGIHLPSSGKGKSCSLVRRSRRLLNHYWLRLDDTTAAGRGNLWFRNRCDHDPRGTRSTGAGDGDGGVDSGGGGRPSLGLFGCGCFGETEGFVDVVRLERLSLGSDELLLIDRLPTGGIIHDKLADVERTGIRVDLGCTGPTVDPGWHGVDCCRWSHGWIWRI